MHTLGPWTIERVPIQSRGGSNTCWKIGPFHACIYDDWRPREAGISEAENEANACLIAAALDLLASCKELRDALAGAMRTMDDKGVDRFMAEMARSGIADGIGGRAETVITKAEGRS